MFDVIDTVPEARALLDQLAATVPDCAGRVRHAVAAAPAGSPPVDEVLAIVAGVEAATDEAVAFLLSAVDWNGRLLGELLRLADEGLAGPLTVNAEQIAGDAWGRALHAETDPRAARRFVPDGEVHESLAELLAYDALAGGRIDDDQWRACDRDAALEVLGMVAARMQREPGEYVGVAGDVDDARQRLRVLRPTLPDRRASVRRQP